MLTLISFDITQIWQGHFWSTRILGAKNRTDTNAQSYSESVEKGNRYFFLYRFSLFCHSCQRDSMVCPFTPAVVIIPPPHTRSWAWPRKHRESSWTEWEVSLRLVITCWLVGTDGTNISKCLCSADPRSLSDRMTDKCRNLRNPQQAEDLPHADLPLKTVNLAERELPVVQTKS